jgi:hypothetical protein
MNARPSPCSPVVSALEASLDTITQLNTWPFSLNEA